jgi:hypothetical protein
MREREGGLAHGCAGVRLVGVFALTLGVSLLLLFAHGTGAALASSAHIPAGSFGSAGSGAGNLLTADGAAVNATTHDVYIADTGNARIAEFDSSGAFVRAWGWGVADGLPAAETCTLVCQKGVAGAGAGQFETPTFVAVDNSSDSSAGDVYVSDTATHLVQKFTSTGELIEAWGDHSPQNGQLDGHLAPSGAFSEFEQTINGIAVDVSGHLWVYGSNPRLDMYEFDETGAFVQEWKAKGSEPVGIASDANRDLYVVSPLGVQKFSESGEFLGTLTETPEVSNTVPPPTGIAADQQTSDLYLDLGETVQHLLPTCDPAEGLCDVQETFGAPELVEGAGVAADPSGVVYVVDRAAGVVRRFATALEVVTGSSVASTTTAAVEGTVNPDGSTVEKCEFQYGTSKEYGESAPCEETIGGGTTPVTVHAQLQALRGGTTYHYRLVAANHAGGTVEGEDRVLTTLPVPVVDELSTTDVTASSAQLNAKIESVGQPTSYHFEWGTTTAYGNVTPIPDRMLTSSASVAASVTISGLSGNTTYHWRVVAVDAGGSSVSPDQTFAYFTSSESLPDGRQYELVSPASKNGALIGALFLHNVAPQVSDDGTRVTAPTIQCFAGSPSCVGSRQTEGEPYDFDKTGEGWRPRSLAPDATEFETSSWWSIDPNSDATLFSIPRPPSGGDQLYARQSSGQFSEIGPLGEGDTSYSVLTQEPLLSTGDLSHVVYATNVPVWPFDEGSRGSESDTQSLYEYAGAAEEPRLVGVRVGGGLGSTDLISTCGTGLGSGERSGFSKRYRSLSTDGRVVYWSADSCATGSGANTGVPVPARELYARIDGEQSDARTVLVSGPTPASCTTVACKQHTTTESDARDAFFEGASNDGEVSVFADTQQLTDAATQDPSTGDSATIGRCGNTTSSSTGCNLYMSVCPARCENAAARELLDLSATQEGGPRVQGTMAISPDGSRVYFVAKGVIATSANQFGQRPRGNSDNLYVFEREAGHAGGNVSFVATLSSLDSREWDEHVEGGIANTTPDGSRLVFTSHRGLTPDATRAEGPSQVYEYDAQSGALIRVSVGQGGFNNNGNTGVGNATITAAARSVESGSVPQRSDPTMSRGGAYVFFQSPVGLTPQALDDVQVETSENGEPGYAQNVYEYHEGTVSLISDGRDTSAVNRVATGSVELLGTDLSGANVFFSTVDQLVLEDQDTQRDYYDAHVCSTAQPCIVRAAGASECQGETCHGAAPGQAATTTPGSATFSGPGNATPAVEAPKPPPKPSTRTQKLAKALKACRTKRNRHKRTACEAAAHKRYPAPHKKKTQKKAPNKAKKSTRRGK